MRAAVDENYRVEVEVVGDLAQALQVLNDGVHDNSVEIDTGRQHAVRNEIMQEISAYEEDDTKG